MIGIDLSYLQPLVNQFMTTPIAIKHRMDPAKDPGNRTGDNTIEFEPELTYTNGWFVDQGARSFDQTGAMSIVADRPTLRVPVGTRVETRDEVLLNGGWWVVSDASTDDTWPVMLKVGLARIE